MIVLKKDLSIAFNGITLTVLEANKPVKLEEKELDLLRELKIEFTEVEEKKEVKKKK